MALSHRWSHRLMNKKRLMKNALRAEVRYLIEEAGVHGLAVGGSTGEGHTLSVGEFAADCGGCGRSGAGACTCYCRNYRQ